MARHEGTDKILGRIGKLMAMAAQQDASPHEAAIALKRAQALMGKHGLGAEDVALGQVREEAAGLVSRNNSSLPEHVTMLVGVIANAFGYKAIFNHGWGGHPSPITALVLILYWPNMPCKSLPTNWTRRGQAIWGNSIPG